MKMAKDILLLTNLLWTCKATVRSQVKIFGTTVGPDFERKAGMSKKKFQIIDFFKNVKITVSHFCPYSHSWPVGDSKKCCEYNFDSQNEQKMLDPTQLVDHCPQGAYIACDARAPTRGCALDKEISKIPAVLLPATVKT